MAGDFDRFNVKYSAPINLQQEWAGQRVSEVSEVSDPRSAIREVERVSA